MLYRSHPHLGWTRSALPLATLCLAFGLAACSSSGGAQADDETAGEASAEAQSAGEASSEGEVGESESTSGADGESESEASGESEDESSSESTGEPQGMLIVPGASVGPIALESTYGDALTSLGEPDLVFVTDAVGFARFDDLGIELVFASPEASAATDDSIIFAIGVKQSAGFTGDLLVGQTRDEVEAKWGAPTDEIPDFSYYGDGISAKFDANNEVDEVGVFAAYENASNPPEMADAPAGDQP